MPDLLIVMVQWTHSDLSQTLYCEDPVVNGDGLFSYRTKTGSSLPVVGGLYSSPEF